LGGKGQRVTEFTAELYIKYADIKYADIIHTNIIMHIFGDYSSKKLKKKYIGKQLPLPTGIITTI
jgi:hypothetical protein